MDVKRSNPNAYKQLAERFARFEHVEGRVGWTDNATYPDGTRVDYVASIQEYGVGKIPPRLGMRFTFAAKKKKWSELAKTLSKKMVQGKLRPESFMELLGAKAESDFKDHIESLPHDLKPLTLAVRYQRDQGKTITGSLVGELAHKISEGKKVAFSSNTDPLHDTGTLLDHLTHTVVAT